MTLSDEELRLKVAEKDGWKNLMYPPIETPHWEKWGWIGTEPNGRCNQPVPDYPHDLNACAALRAWLSDNERVQYIAYLVSQVSIGSRIRELYWAIANATPRQHCLAFIKCKGVEL